MKQAAALLLAAAGVSCVAGAFPGPYPKYLSAPWTPFWVNGSYGVNTSAVALQAAHARSVHVNTIWVSGSMAQYDALTMDERKDLATAWVAEQADPSNPFFTIIHVGTTVQAQAIELAQHAKQIGAHAVSSVPPFYPCDLAATPELLAQWLAPIAAAAAPLPFYYYHIPGCTNTKFNTWTELIPAFKQYIPTFAGIKYVTSDDMDYLGSQTTWGPGGDGSVELLFAPEPKLQSLPLGAQSFILAELMYNPTLQRMLHAYWSGDLQTAQKENLWKNSAGAIFNANGGGMAERYAQRFSEMGGVDLGPPRAPRVQITEEQGAALYTALQDFGFFNQTIPDNYLPPNAQPWNGK